MTDLQLCIALSQRCVAARDRGDYLELCEIMKERDAVYLRLDPVDVRSFVAWADDGFTSEQVAAFLETGNRSHIAMTKGDLETVAELADEIAQAVQEGDSDEASSLYGETMHDFAGLPPVFRDAAWLAFQRAVADRVGAPRTCQLQEVLLAQVARWLREHEPMMTPEQVAAARAAVERLRVGGWRVPARAEA